MSMSKSRKVRTPKEAKKTTLTRKDLAKFAGLYLEGIAAELRRNRRSAFPRYEETAVSTISIRCGSLDERFCATANLRRQTCDGKPATANLRRQTCDGKPATARKSPGRC